MSDLPAADCCVPLNYLNRIPPFSTPSFDPAWKSADVVLLAKSIDADKAFDRMPILADALEEAGCDDERILTHCRGEHVHEPYCWVMELIRGEPFPPPVVEPDTHEALQRSLAQFERAERRKEREARREKWGLIGTVVAVVNLALISNCGKNVPAPRTQPAIPQQAVRNPVPLEPLLEAAWHENPLNPLNQPP